MRTIPALAYKDVLKHQVQPLRNPGQQKQKRKKQLRVVKDSRCSASNSRQAVSVPFPVFMLVVSAITAGMIVNVAQHALVAQSSYQAEALKKDIQIEQQLQEKLLAQRARLGSPGRIEAIATKQLSMIKAPKVSYLRIGGQEPANVTVAQNQAVTR